MKNFKNLKVWQKGMEIAKNVYSISKDLPTQEKFGLISQFTRAAVSISSNIAEGSSRSSSKEYNRYLEIALGSTFELETQLLIIKDLQVLPIKNIHILLEMIIEEQKMLHGFIAKLKAIN